MIEIWFDWRLCTYTSGDMSSFFIQVENQSFMCVSTILGSEKNVTIKLRKNYKNIRSIDVTSHLINTSAGKKNDSGYFQLLALDV